jgi:isorenieratene synthase
MTRPQRWILPRAGGRERAERPVGAVVVGGGIAGLAAATVLSERGVDVTLLERETQLGGRAASWPDRHVDGEAFEMERGFHAFFRQYYNLRALLRRVDPKLSMLVPLDDYPILGSDAELSFCDLPRRTPWNLLALTRRTPSLDWRRLRSVNVSAALEMLRFDHAQTPQAFDALDAGAYLDALNFPPPARRLLFDVFAHSFFNAEAEMSAGELLSMFHFYFTGNPEGLLFDVARAPFGRVLWEPLAARLCDRGARIERGRRVTRIERAGERWCVRTQQADGQARVEQFVTELVVLALPVQPLRELVAASPDLSAQVDFARKIDSLRASRPFAVWRLWLDRPLRGDRAPFVGTTGLGRLDNVSIYDRFEDESADWARRHGGSVVELHAYAVEPDADPQALRAELLRGLHAIYPEAESARRLAERFLWRDDCPAFAPASLRDRPEVATPFGNLALAGDFVRLPFPSALMERAAAAGILAANTLLARLDLRAEPLESIAGRGWLAPPRLRRGVA